MSVICKNYWRSLEVDLYLEFGEIFYIKFYYVWKYYLKYDSMVLLNKVNPQTNGMCNFWLHIAEILNVSTRQKSKSMSTVSFMSAAKMADLEKLEAWLTGQTVSKTVSKFSSLDSKVSQLIELLDKRKKKV